MANPQPRLDPDLPAPLARFSIRLLAATYEAVLLSALLLIATAAFLAVAGDSTGQPRHLLLQIYLLAVMGAYLVWSWSGGRRTLPMRTWRLRLVTRSGAPPSVRRALVRFLAALATLPPAGLGFLWGLFDPERQFLHDRIAGTRLVRDPPRATQRADPAR